MREKQHTKRELVTTVTRSQETSRTELPLKGTTTGRFIL